MNKQKVFRVQCLSKTSTLEEIESFHYLYIIEFERRNKLKFLSAPNGIFTALQSMTGSKKIQFGPATWALSLK